VHHARNSHSFCGLKTEHALNEAGEAISMKKQGMWGWEGRMGGGAVVGLLLMSVLVLLPARASARANDGGQVSVGVSVSFGPPPLPVYAQPMCPGPGYIWTPGYWAYDRDDGYYWVPGTWVMAPFSGALWTPGYWGYDPAVAVFVWHPGYWGPRVGFYGGIDYGFGYFGVGYDGGYWRGGVFFYNRAVSRVDVYEIHNVYYREDFHREHWDRERDRISYNGGRGGIDARPTREDFDAERERRMGPIREQFQQERYARRMPEARWSENHGRPDIAATNRPGRFMEGRVEHASRAGGPYRPNQPGDRSRQQGGQWHSFGQASRQEQRGQQGYRDMGRQGNQYQQRPNDNRQQMRQDQRQPSGWRQQPQQRDNRGWQQQQQRDYRGGQQQQQQQRYQQRPDNRRQARQPQGNWHRQQARPQQQDRRGGPAQRHGGNNDRQQPNRNQGKRDNPHGGRHR
jgi:hypothetical protein